MTQSFTQLLTEYHLGVLDDQKTQEVETILSDSAPALNEYFAIKREFNGSNDQLEPDVNIKASLKKQIFNKQKHSLISNILRPQKSLVPSFAAIAACLALVIFFGDKYLNHNDQIQSSTLNAVKVDASNSNSVSLNVL